MAARKLSPKTKVNTTGVPKRSFSGILPNLPIKFSEGLLAAIVFGLPGLRALVQAWRGPTGI